MSIIDHIKSHFNPEYISELGIELGESESGISKATKGLIPLVMNGLANLAEHPDVVNAVYNSHSEINEATGISKIQELLEENVNLLSSIEAYSKVSRESSKILFQKVLERTLLTFGKHCVDENIEPSRIPTVLKEQKGIIPGSLPAGLSHEVLGLKEIVPTEKEIVTDSSNHNNTEISKKPVEISTNQPTLKKKKTSFWTWLLPLLLIGLASWFLWNEYLQTLNTPKAEPKPLKQAIKKDTLEAIKKDSVIIKDTIQTPTKNIK